MDTRNGISERKNLDSGEDSASHDDVEMTDDDEDS